MGACRLNLGGFGQVKFLDDLRAESEREGGARMGEVFVNFAPYFRMYTDYVANYDASIAAILKLKAKNTAFQELLAAASSDSGCGSNLEALLITPVQVQNHASSAPILIHLPPCISMYPDSSLLVLPGLVLPGLVLPDPLRRRS